jgi:hypothetical protein
MGMAFSFCSTVCFVNETKISLIASATLAYSLDIATLKLQESKLN